MHGYLRGAMIRIVAVRLFAGTFDPSRPIHHNDWLAMLTAAGYGVAGQDPSATFLTQVNRSPIIVRGSHPGTYAINTQELPRLRMRLAQLNDELLALQTGQQTFEQIAPVRERRSQLVAEISRVERALEEAIEALGVADT